MKAPAEILLVEDDEGDVELVRVALAALPGTPVNLRVAGDGEEALSLLRGDGPRPGIVLLDLNLPRKSGREVLAEVRADPRLRALPVVVLTTSDRELDIREAYALGANCYVCKPFGLDALVRTMSAIIGFWFGVATLPPCEGS